MTAPDPRNVRDALLEAGHTPEQVERMLGALTDGALLSDHANDLTETYWHLCSKMMWTFVLDGEPAHPEHHLLRAARYLTRTDANHPDPVWNGVRRFPR